MPLSDLRVGSGFDSHVFGDTPPLALGCTQISQSPRLRGHSDGDALTHAVIDALLGAAGLGDIGVLFPDGEEEWKGAPGNRLLELAVGQLNGEGWSVVNVDVTVIATRPDIKTHRASMEAALSEIVRAPVSIKGKRPEGLGDQAVDTLSCMAVALIHQDR